MMVFGESGWKRGWGQEGGVLQGDVADGDRRTEGGAFIWCLRRTY